MKLRRKSQLEDSKGPLPLVCALENACYAVVRNHDKAPVFLPVREWQSVGLAGFAARKVTDSNCNTWKSFQFIHGATDFQVVSDTLNPPLLDDVELGWIEDPVLEV